MINTYRTQFCHLTLTSSCIIPAGSSALSDTCYVALVITCCTSNDLCMCRAEPSHEEGDDDDVPEADEEEIKNIFSTRNTLGVCILILM